AAGQPPAVAQLVGGEGAGVDRADRDLARDDPDLAFLAGAVSAAGRVDCDPVPAGGVEDRRATGHADLGAVGQEAQSHPLGAVVGRRRLVARQRRRLGRRRAHELAARSCCAAAWRARCAAIQLPPHGSWPRSRSEARTACTQTSAVDMIALVNPAAIAIGSKPALSTWRWGRPKDTLDAPRHMLTPSSSRIRQIVASVIVTASVAAPTVMASGSMITSSVAIPWSLATLTILRAHSRRCSGVSGIPVSSLARPITAALYLATSGRI